MSFLVICRFACLSICLYSRIAGMLRELGDGLIMQTAGPTMDVPVPIDELRKAVP